MKSKRMGIQKEVKDKKGSTIEVENEFDVNSFGIWLNKHGHLEN